MIRHHLANGEVVKDIKGHMVKCQEARYLYESMAKRRKEYGKKEQTEKEHS